MNKILLLTALFSSAFVVYGEEIPHMVQANYGQGAPYNHFCPDYDAAGCGPVAIAEILSYYKSPAKGRGYVSYENPKEAGQIITADLENMPFDWSNILNDYTPGQYTDQQADAVANLVFACGAAMRVAYGISTSTQNKNRMVYYLQHNLCISPDSRYLNRQYYSTSEWLEILNGQLRGGHPVFYRGSKIFGDSEIGHMFVIDGLNDEGLYHANWGHDGVGNKYTDINILNQGDPNGIPGGTWTCYNFKQAMMMNCYPTPDAEHFPLQWCDLYEPIRINDSQFENEISIKTGKTFTLNTKVVSCSEEAMPVSCKFALLRDGMEIASLYNVNYNSFNPFYIGTIKANMSLPDDLEDGDYEIILLSKSEAEPEWQPVHDNPINRVTVNISNGNARITAPSCHAGNPYLYIPDPIQVERVSNGLELRFSIVNPTINNFSDKVRFTLTTSDGTYEYEALVCSYSQTNTKYGVLIPDSKLDLSGVDVSSVSAEYYYAAEDSYFHIGDSDNIHIVNAESADIAHDILIHDITGNLLTRIPAAEISTGLQTFLSTLPHGIYILSEGKKTSKIII